MTMLSIDVQIIHSEENLIDSLKVDCSGALTNSSNFADDLNTEIVQQNSHSSFGSDSGCISNQSSPHNEILNTPEEPKKKRGGWPKGKKRKTSAIAFPPPKAPSTGYIIFMNERRQLMKQSNPSLPFYEVTKLLGNEWSHLTPFEKKVYLRRGDDDKKRYREELKAYQQSESYVAYHTQRKANEVEAIEDGGIANETVLEPVINNSIEDDHDNELYCIVCDQYFISQHNKQEHLYGRQHLSNISGETNPLDEVKHITKGNKLKKTNKDDRIQVKANENFKTKTNDVSEAMKQVILLTLDRETEVSYLRENIQILQEKHSKLLESVSTWKDEKTKRQEELDGLNAIASTISSQLVNLRNVPKLFGVINF